MAAKQRRHGRLLVTVPGDQPDHPEPWTVRPQRRRRGPCTTLPHHHRLIDITVPIGTYAEAIRVINRARNGRSPTKISLSTASGVGNAWCDDELIQKALAPPVHGDGRPDGFHNTERPRALQETVDRRQGAGGCEGEDKPGAPIFQRIEYQHGRDGCQTKQRETIHLIQSHGSSTLL